MSGIHIRRATSRDLDAVVALRMALLREYPDHPIYGRLRPDAEARARPVFEAQLESDHEVIFLAEHDGRAIGLLRCVDTVASSLLTPERYCYVSSVYVEPAFRRQGVLTALLACAQDWCTRRGLYEMRLHSVGSRLSAAAAWEAAGFEVVEQLRVLRLTSGDGDAGVRASADAAGRSVRADEHRVPPA